MLRGDRRLSAGAAASQVMPFVRCISAAAPASYAGLVRPARWQRLWNGRLIEDVAHAGLQPAAAAAEGSRDPGDGEEESFDDIEME